MKFIYLIFIALFISCFSSKKEEPNHKAYYFYFENNGNTMNYIYSSKKNRKKYFYNIQMADNIFFEAKKIDEGFKIEKLKHSDTLGLNVKTYSWLNQFNNSSRIKFFNSNFNKRFYIIEKDSLNNDFNLIEVKFIDEIE